MLLQFCVEDFRLSKIASGMSKKNDCNRISFFSQRNVARLFPRRLVRETKARPDKKSFET